jgi:hypothetical protein
MSYSGRFGEKEETLHGSTQMMTVCSNKFAIPSKQLYSLCSSRTFFAENQAESRCNTKQKKISYLYIRYVVINIAHSVVSLMLMSPIIH